MANDLLLTLKVQNRLVTRLSNIVSWRDDLTRAKQCQREYIDFE